jgi:adenine-specific DNA-methyltransferase
MIVTEALTKFQNLLHELFQFDAADLDFGIYRIMNQKRDVLDEFITHRLPDIVRTALSQGALGEQADAANELKEVVSNIKENFGDAALNEAGNLVSTYHETPLGKKYLALKQKAAGAGNREALEAGIFNHLYSFFSRYYQEGDFISKRRYSKKERYAIPYNGEEVMLYWANHDQYYIKTGEYFTDYTWKAPNGVTVHFKIQAADVEQNNVKGDKRFFLPQMDDLTWDEAAQTITLPFEFRPLNAKEGITYGTKNQQANIIAKAVEAMPKRLNKLGSEAQAALSATRKNIGDDEPLTWFEHHLRQYTRRNTSDFFIHKDLKGFLSRELDFYLKNEVLNLDELDAGGETRAEGWFQMMRTIKAIGAQIIDFLAQIEDFQKMLWEKRKFVTETFYCVAVGSIDKAFHEAIAGCDAQWEEWKTLRCIDKSEKALFTPPHKHKIRFEWLRAHPAAMIDTRYFPKEFVDKLLASFGNLEAMTDGVLVHSENWQGLNQLACMYRDNVRAIYIDPPYNTAASEILYKNNYKHSTFLSLADNRLNLAYSLLTKNGAISVAIDDAEYARMHFLLSNLFSEENHLATVVVRSKPQGRAMAVGFSPNHEYAVFFAKSDSTEVGRLPRDEERLARYSESDENGIFAWSNFRGTGANSYRQDRPKLFYPIWIETTTGELTIPELNWNEAKSAWETSNSKPKNQIEINPVDDESIERVWSTGWERAQKEAQTELLAREMNGKWQIYRKYRPNQIGALPGTWWGESKYSASESGTKVLQNIAGDNGSFSYPKSISTVEDCVRSTGLGAADTILDFFAGSGTTGHAVINLNREDGGRRKFILIEMAHYFDTVLLPRLKKVAFSPEWKDGQPKRDATAEKAQRGPRLFKVMRLESYEDALNNITFEADSPQTALQFDDYLLQYMLAWESRNSDTLLNVKQLANPFAYQLRIHRDGETRTQPVDLAETFNALLGLRVKTRTVLHSLPSPADGRNVPVGGGVGSGGNYLIYRGATREGRTVVVIWRNTENWKQADYERDRDFVAAHKLAEGTDDVYVNGDSLIAGAQALDGLFKARMFAPVEA